MPKSAVKDSDKLRAIVREYPTEFAITPQNGLFCKLCECLVKFEKRFFVDSHRASSKHTSKCANKVQSSSSCSQQFISTNGFVEDVTTAFLAADIPLKKLNHPAIRNLFKILGKDCPSESSCRHKVQDLGEQEIARVKESLAGKKVFLVVDETSIDTEKYMNILIGDVAVPSKVYLVDCVLLADNINNNTVTHNVDDIIHSLSIDRYNFLLLLSDAASYMTLAGQNLKHMYPHLWHVTCISHLLHNCALIVRSK